MPEHEILNAIRDLIAAAEEAGADDASLDPGRVAYQELCGLFANPPGEGPFFRHTAADEAA